MMGRITLFSDSAPGIRLRAIGPDDLEELRVWKNAKREFFFFKELIDPEMQRSWYEGYLKRPGDFMFIVETEGRKAGCLGFRLQAEEADGYNIIGLPEFHGRGVMRSAMRLMCSFVKAEKAPRVSLKVLKNNPAVGWYEKCGFEIVGRAEDHLLMALGKDFVPCPYQVERLAS